MTTPGHFRSSAFDPAHEPVLVREVVSLLRPRAGGFYVDATVGLGGHTAALLEAGAGRVLGVDRDEAALAVARERLASAGDRVTLLHQDYRTLPALLTEPVDGMLVDLGVSSLQLDDPERGFSFKQAGPLDMRMDRSSGATLADRLAAVDEAELADVIFRLGDERRSRRVARAIVAARDRGELGDTGDLARVVRRAAGSGRWERRDPATKTFQALRLWVNREGEGLETFLEAVAAHLSPSGRLAVIAFHSLEDRVVKHTFRRLATETETGTGIGAWQLVTRRAVQPEPDEVARNPRARSARLRVLERAA
ncbi:MAG TPA: 16S rRNA (cytosine(1402)-N(4))-methyltransferase RsmH [Vicinamibacterales bacterium]|nr:16S rRNA (cytosine(1402)-N(4))-methyltransferase RsmH [Vicinamibacterales bacterium]